MKSCIGHFLFIFSLLILSVFLISCPEDNNSDDCENIVGQWDFIVVATWDCDGDPDDIHYGEGLHINQVDCGISITGTFYHSLNGIMTGTMTGSTFSIDYFDDEEGCTLKIRGSVTATGDLTGTWEDDCYNSAGNCSGESGTFTAVKN